MKKFQKINVTEKIIKASRLLVDDCEKNYKIDACHCPISLALNKNTDYHGWFVSSDKAFVIRSDDTVNFFLPRSAKRFLKQWSLNFRNVKPFSFMAPRQIVMIKI